MSSLDHLTSILDAERQPQNPLRPHQVKSYQEEKQRLDEIVHAPSWVEGDRTQAMKRYRSLSQMLETQAAKKTDNPNEVKRLADEVAEQIIRPAMVPQEVMRRNPSGAVGAHIRQEHNSTTKRAILAWKRAMRALDPENDDPSFTDANRFRPQIGPQSGASTFMADAQIPGVFAMSPQAKANWPAEMPEQGTANSALAQVQTREKKERKPLSEEQKQALRERLAKAREKQAEKRATGG